MNVINKLLFFNGLYILLFFISTAVLAESPFDEFSTKKNYTDQTIMHWEQADDIQVACNKASKKYGTEGFKILIDACSFQYKDFFKRDVCHIITKKQTSMWTIGHEMRHCFQGEFHKYPPAKK